jgi:hypothetical protein
MNFLAPAANKRENCHPKWYRSCHSNYTHTPLRAAIQAVPVNAATQMFQRLCH